MTRWIRNEIPLSRELEFLDYTPESRNERFGDRLAVEIHAEPDTLNLLMPPLILQPLVENAIRHGIGKHKGDDCVEVFARKEDGGLHIEVWNANSVVEEESEKLFCAVWACAIRARGWNNSMERRVN